MGVMEIMQPAGATRWIAEHHPPGPIFHSFIDGGYLIWHLYPEYQILGDGRLEVYGVERRLELNAERPQGFRVLDKKYHFNTALLNFGRIDFSELLWYLHKRPEWRLVFVDDIAAVFVRADRSAIAAEVDLTDPQLLRSTNSEHSVSDAYRRKARHRFFKALKRHRRARTIWKQMVRDYPEFQN